MPASRSRCGSIRSAAGADRGDGAVPRGRNHDAGGRAAAPRDGRGQPGRQEPLDLTVFISCYNEEEYIIATIETVRDALKEIGSISYEIIVVDDCSKDRSSDIVKEYIAAHPEERILLRTNKNNRGLAQNYLDVAFVGKGKYYRLICGDNAEPKETMIAVFRQIGQADMISPTTCPAKARACTAACSPMPIPAWSI